MARIDSAILHEIARVVQTRSKVPDRVHIQKRQYQITYLEDHRQRMEDALRRHDSHVLNMLFGQLASKVKYQALRDSAAANKRDGARRPSPSAPAAKSKAATSKAPRSKTPKSKANTKSHKTVSAKRVAPKRNAAAKPAIKKSSKKAAVKPKKRSRR